MTIIDETKFSHQRAFDYWVDWSNKNVPGANFAERHSVLCKNWIDTHNKSYTELWWDDVRGKTLVKRIESLEKQLNEVKNDERVLSATK